MTQAIGPCVIPRRNARCSTPSSQKKQAASISGMLAPTISAGVMHATAFLVDQIVRVLFDFACERLFRVPNPFIEQDVDALIDAMTVSVELVDSRLEQAAEAPALLRLADSQSHAGLVLGDWVPYVRQPWHQQVCEIYIDDEAPQEHMGTHSLEDPAWLLPTWLRHLTRHGGTVPAGTVVTTGTWNGVNVVQPGTRVAVTFPGIGSVSMRV